MSFLKKLASDSAIYGLNSILGRSIGFALVPLYTTAFPAPHALALYTELFTVVTFLNVLYTYGMETTFFRFANKEKSNFDKNYNLAQTALIISSIFFSGLIILFSSKIASFFDAPGQGSFIIWLAIIVALDAIVAIPFARLRFENKAKKYVFIRMLSVLINVALNFLFLYVFKEIFEGKILHSLQPLVLKLYSPSLGVGYIILANLIANLIYIPFLWQELVVKFRFYFDKSQFANMWNYGYPILILGFAGMINQGFDRIMLTEILPLNFYKGLDSKTVLGIYGQCYKLSVLISLATQSFRFAADPFFFSKAEDKNAPSVFAEVTKYFTIFCCILWVAICLNLDLISYLFIKNEIYKIGLGIVPLLLLGNLLLGIYFNLAVWFKLTDKTKYGTYITIFGAAINITLNYILIPQIGFMGCAWAFMVSCSAMTVLCYWLGNKHFPVPYNLKSIVGYLLGSALLIWLNSKIVITNLYLSVFYHGLIMLLFLAVIIIIERKHVLPKKYQSLFS
jgi:O-antigen/teichoic acid export membrane protein